MIRGKRPAHDPLPDGIRQDTRKHTRHCLRPTPELVGLYLDDPTEENWHAFERGYEALIEARFEDDRAPFDELAELARNADVYLGCSCPTKRNPDVNRCHTVLALRFMNRKYPDLEVVPSRTDPAARILESENTLVRYDDPLNPVADGDWESGD